MPKPHHTIVDGNIEAAIWKNENKSKSGYYTFSLSKTYEKDGKTKYTSSYGYFDGIRVARITLQAVEWIAQVQNTKASDAASESAESGKKKRPGKRERERPAA